MTRKRAIAGVTAAIYIVGALVMTFRGDFTWAEVQAALAVCSAVTVVTL